MVGTFLIHPRLSSALSSGIKEIIIKTNLNGFFDSEGRPLKELNFNKGDRVRLVFEYDETVWDAYRTGNRHQFAILSEESGFRIESEEISFWNKKESLEFIAGEDGVKRYRIICIVDCVGMDLLGYSPPFYLYVNG